MSAGKWQNVWKIVKQSWTFFYSKVFIHILRQAVMEIFTIQPQEEKLQITLGTFAN